MEDYSETASAARSVTYHGTATIQFNGLNVNVGFDIHAETPVEQKEELIRMAALQCVADFFDAHRGVQTYPATQQGEAV